MEKWRRLILASARRLLPAKSRSRLAVPRTMSVAREALGADLVATRLIEVLERGPMLLVTVRPRTHLRRASDALARLAWADPDPAVRGADFVVIEERAAHDAVTLALRLRSQGSVGRES